MMTVGFARKRLHLKQYILIEVRVKWPATTDLLLDASEMEKNVKSVSMQIVVKNTMMYCDEKAMLWISVGIF